MRIRRSFPVAAGVAFAATLPAGPVPAPEAADAASARQDSVERAVVRRINQIRARAGLRRLHSSGGLALAADVKALEILSSDSLSHTSPDGTPMSQRIRRYVRAQRVGETIAWVSPHTRHQARVVVRSWMGSPPHRAALLSPSFRRIGVSRRVGRIGGGRLTVMTANLASAR
jgi:uncharacterized protein YkwD